MILKLIKINQRVTVQVNKNKIAFDEKQSILFYWPGLDKQYNIKLDTW